ncbi:hypothetical protein OC834_006648 [Tilletia horrida]|nr:hypothetical protein OC834_006648 [Tilletia horrida]
MRSTIHIYEGIAIILERLRTEAEAQVVGDRTLPAYSFSAYFGSEEAAAADMSTTHCFELRESRRRGASSLVSPTDDLLFLFHPLPALS